jgi:hypothetical protein
MDDAIELRGALKVVAQVLKDGESTHKPGRANFWLALSVREHALHAFTHLDMLMVDALPSEDHLAHAATRLPMALELRERSREARKVRGAA